MTQKLLITDLDNTLYDWVTFFSESFRSMVAELTQILSVPEEALLAEFKAVHQRYGNSEQPFAVLELPIVQKRFPNLSRDEVASKLDVAFHRFNSVRKRRLCLYPGVGCTLAELNSAGVRIVAHTEAIAENSFWRLRALDVERYFSRLYTLQGCEPIHLPRERQWTDPPMNFVVTVPREERKPNPRLLLDICEREGASPSSTFYVGDSLVRDVAMAKEAGVTAVWARYGTIYDPEAWAYLVRVTHWTDQDVARERDLKLKFGGVVPDYAISAFSELKDLIFGRS
jgi:phosphoglycolate phosphatase